MQYSVFCILVLAASEPLLAYAKVVVVIPQQIKRSHTPSWRPPVPRYRKSSHSSDLYLRKYHGHYHGKKALYSNLPFPHGGDDFDQGHGPVNHVHIPYGKDINHAISFGKGYIPYDRIKGSFSLGHERSPETQEHKSLEPEYASTSYSTSSTEYSPSGYESSQPETYFTDPETALNYNERRNDLKKYYTARSIEKELTSDIDLAGSLDQGKEHLLLLQQKATELYKNLSPQPQGGIVLPAGIPPATIAGSKEGIVLRDTVALDEYQQKLHEMTKSWPQFAVNGAAAVTNGFHSQPAINSFPTVGQTSSFTGSISWPLNFAQPKQGYAVKEDTMEPPHDFRTMPIQTAPLQTFPTPVNAILPSLAQTVHG